MPQADSGATPKADAEQPPEQPAVLEHRVDPDDWDMRVAAAGSPQIIVGGPGTGKTQFLCERVASAILHDGFDASRIIVLALSRRGVSDIRNRLVKLLGNTAHRVNATTYHSLAMRLVEAHATELGWEAPPSILTGVEQERFIAELLTSENADRWPTTYRGLLGTASMADEVTNFILRAAEQRLRSEDIAAFDRDQWAPLPAFLDRYNAALTLEGRTDYGRTLTEATTLIETNDEIAAAYQLVVADEYEDTSPVQAQMLMALARHTPDLVVAADPYQSTYSFRGSDINNVFSFPADVSRHLSRSAERLILTTSFRVPEKILTAAVSVTDRELPGGAGRVLTTRTGGAVTCHEFSVPGQEAEWIAQDIERIHLTEGIPLERIAVFIRSHSAFVEGLTRALDRRHIEHTYTDERLSDEPIIRFLHDLVLSADGGEEADAAIRRVLQGPIVGLTPGLVGTLPDSREDWPEWIRAEAYECGALARLMDDPRWANEWPAPQGLWHVWSELPQLGSVATDPEREPERAAWTAYAQVVERDGERSGAAPLVDLVDLTSRFDFEADALFSASDSGGVSIATLHRAKGTEFDAVYIADATEGNLPDLRSRDSMLGVRHLNPHLPSATADYVTFRLDEERRLAYTAMTRATSQIVWTATTAGDQLTRSQNQNASPSRFMRLVATTTPASLQEEPLTPSAMIARVRRTVADPMATDVDRLAGLVLLARAGEPGSDPMDRYGIRERGDHAGIVPKKLRLSPSQATAYERCPRQYAVERFLLTRSNDTPALKLGTLIHAVMEKAEDEAISAGLDRASEATACRWLDALWAEHGFGDDAVGRAWKTRAMGILGAVYEKWPSSGRPVILEVELPLDVDGVPWTGRADRIEHDGDAFTVVDYKTGQVATVADAAESIQLGYYVLAARDSGAIPAMGVVSGASFWYLKDEPERKSLATRQFDMTQLASVQALMADIAENIREERFAPTPGSQCKNCSVALVCPAVSDGTEAFAS